VIAGAAAASILTLLGLVHLYWAAGGTFGKGATVPVRDGKPVLRPTPLTTAIVAVGLFAMAALLAANIGWIAIPITPLSLRVCLWLITATFSLRALGDFRYVGFFKRVRDSRFAKLDTQIYSPLCLLLAILVTISAISRWF
jgi:Protein of unknown function (DUF3995)